MGESVGGAVVGKAGAALGDAVDGETIGGGGIGPFRLFFMNFSLNLGQILCFFFVLPRTDWGLPLPLMRDR